MSRVHIATDPKEVLDRVDDALAWLRVASEAGTHYDQTAYRCAEMQVSLGHGRYGVMSAAGVDAYEDADSVPFDTTRAEDRARIAQEVSQMGRLLNELGERPCCAVLTEGGGDPLSGMVGDSGDSIEDLVGLVGSEGSGQCLTSDRIKYHLEGMRLLSKTEASDSRVRHLLEQGVRPLLYQSHMVLNDGRTTAGQLLLGSTPTGLVSMASGGTFDFGTLTWAHRVADLIAVQWLRRDVWTIELSATPARTGVGLATDAIGAQALVADLKDKSDGAVRMVHWVAEHLRRRREGATSVVRAHLRGRQTFRCGKYWATIYPSRADLDKACNGKRFDRKAKP